MNPIPGTFAPTVLVIIPIAKYMTSMFILCNNSAFVPPWLTVPILRVRGSSEPPGGLLKADSEKSHTGKSPHVLAQTLGFDRRRVNGTDKLGHLVAETDNANFVHVATLARQGKGLPPTLIGHLIVGRAGVPAPINGKAFEAKGAQREGSLGKGWNLDRHLA